MRWTSLLLAGLLGTAIAAPATAQEYWEYEPLEGEWEQHYPTAGVEYEYEGGEIEVEAEQYERETGGLYHEQEWYDPSDWFEFGSDFDYEPEYGYGYGGGYYDEGYYDDDWFYDYYEPEWDEENWESWE